MSNSNSNSNLHDMMQVDKRLTDARMYLDFHTVLPSSPSKSPLTEGDPSRRRSFWVQIRRAFLSPLQFCFPITLDNAVDVSRSPRTTVTSSDHAIFEPIDPRDTVGTPYYTLLVQPSAYPSVTHR